MEKVYVIMFNNGDEYEDEEEFVWCVCRTKEKAEGLSKELTEMFRKEFLEFGDLDSSDPRNAEFVNKWGRPARCTCEYFVKRTEFFWEEANFIE